MEAIGLRYPPEFVKELTFPELPAGYRFRETRYANLILREAFSERYRDLLKVLAEFTIDVNDLPGDRGSNPAITDRFDSLLSQRSWGERTIPRSRLVDDGMSCSAGGYPIDIYGTGPDKNSYPGIALELEWSIHASSLNCMLLNFSALHLEGALAVAVFVVSTPRLHDHRRKLIESGTFLDKPEERPPIPIWDEIVSYISGGSAGGCPILLVGIEPERIAAPMASAS